MEENTGVQEMQNVDQKVNHFDYGKDKAGWVVMSGRTKVKLRKYIDSLAHRLSKINDEIMVVNKAEIIRQYNIGGLKGMNTWYYTTVIGIYDELKTPHESLNLKTDE